MLVFSCTLLLGKGTVHLSPYLKKLNFDPPYLFSRVWTPLKRESTHQIKNALEYLILIPRVLNHPHFHALVGANGRPQLALQLALLAKARRKVLDNEDDTEACVLKSCESHLLHARLFVEQMYCGRTVNTNATDDDVFRKHQILVFEYDMVRKEQKRSSFFEIIFKK